MIHLNSLRLVALTAAMVSAGLTHAQAPAVPQPQGATILMVKKPAQEPLRGTPATQEPIAAALRLPLPRKAAPIQAEELPGLGITPGEMVGSKSKPIKVGADRNEVLYVSLTQTNRISTPFETPIVIDSSGATIKTVDSDVYVLPASIKPMTIYVTGGAGKTVGLTLVPRANLSAQSFVLQPEGQQQPTIAQTPAEDAPVISDYVGRINNIIKQLCLDNTPQGFTKAALPASVMTSDSVVVVPKFKYAGSTFDVHSYQITSASSSPLELSEEAFYTSKKVRSVAFFPRVLLQRGEDTTVFVITDRETVGAQ
jgi:conjugal transfer pilus assembly protein TraK